MAKKISAKIVAVGALLVILAIVSLANASVLNIENRETTGCACEQITIDGTIENPSPDFAIYQLSSEFQNGGFGSFVSPSVEVDAYGSSRFEMITAADCRMPAGNYTYRIIATGNRGDVLKQEGTVRINECRLLDLRILNMSQTVCIGERAEYEIAVKNFATENEDVKLTTNFAKGIYAFSESGFTLAAGEERKGTLRVDVPETYSPKNEQETVFFSITAEGTGTFGTRSKIENAALIVNKCGGVQISLPLNFTAQVGEKSEMTVTLKNGKTEDGYMIILENCPSFATASVSQIELKKDETGTFIITFKPGYGDVGTGYSCKVVAQSRKTGKRYTATARNLDIVQEYSASIIAYSGNASGNTETLTKICKGENASITFEVNNSGKAGNYSFSVSGTNGKLNASNAYLGSGESVKISFAPDANLQAGKYALKMKADSGYSTANASTTLEIEDCYSSSLSLSKSSVKTCEGETEILDATLRNSGTKNETYTVSIEGNISARTSEQFVNLASGSSKAFQVTVPVARGQKAGTYNVKVIAKGSGETAAATAVIEVQKAEQCHSISIEAERTTIESMPGNGMLETLKVRNKGKAGEDISLELRNAPSWVYLKPELLSVESNSAKEFYLYSAPQYDTETKEFAFTVVASSAYASGSKELKIKVLPLEQRNGREKNVTANTTKIKNGISINENTLPKELETGGVETPVEIEIQNRLDKDATGIVISFAKGIRAKLQETVATLKPNEKKKIKAVLVPEEGTKAGNVTFKIGVYGNEAYAEKEIAINIIEPEIVLEGLQQAVDNEGNETAIETKLLIRNEGEETKVTIELVPALNTNISATSLTLKSKKSTEVELKTSIANGQEKNATLMITDEHGKKYPIKLVFSENQPESISGLFVTALERNWWLLVIAILVGVGFYALTRTDKVEEKPDAS